MIAPNNASELAKRLVRIDDIRGRWRDVLSPDIAIRIAENFSNWLHSNGLKSVVCGHDGRTTSEELMRLMVPVLRAGGIAIGDAGLMASPSAFVTCRAYESDASIVFTASHNPLGYAGLKILVGSDPPSLEILRSFVTDEPVRSDQLLHGDLSTVNSVDAWQKATPVSCATERVVFDCLNGPTGPLLAAIADALGPNAQIKSQTPLPDYGGRDPDPTALANRQKMTALVQDNGASLGFSFDGDGDRCIVFDENGSEIAPDLIACLFMLLKPHTFRSGVAVDVKASGLTERVAEQNCIPLLRVPTGQFHLRKAVRGGFSLGAELSGHYSFADKNRFDDGPYAALQIISLYCDNPELFKRELDMLRTNYFVSPEYRLNFLEGVRGDVMSVVDARARSLGLPIQRIDGVRVSTNTGYIMIRPSMTEDILSIRHEGIDRNSYISSGILLKELIKDIVDGEHLCL